MSRRVNTPDGPVNFPDDMSNEEIGKILKAHYAFETYLPADKEKAFQAWKSRVAPNDSGSDYDLRGAFAAGIRPSQAGHWPDTYKKPNHPTFSDESQYASRAPGKAGHWEGEKFIPPTIGGSTNVGDSATGAKDARGTGRRLVDAGLKLSDANQDFSKEASTGMAKGAGSTAYGAGKLIQSLAHAINPNIPIDPAFQGPVERHFPGMAAQGPQQKLGKLTEQGLEFLVPGTGQAKAGGLAARMLAGGLEAGAVRTVQAGDPTDPTVRSAALGGAVAPAIGAAVNKLLGIASAAGPMAKSLAARVIRAKTGGLIDLTDEVSGAGGEAGGAASEAGRLSPTEAQALLEKKMAESAAEAWAGAKYTGPPGTKVTRVPTFTLDLETVAPAAVARPPVASVPAEDFGSIDPMPTTVMSSPVQGPSVPTKAPVSAEEHVRRILATQARMKYIEGLTTGRQNIPSTGADELNRLFGMGAEPAAPAAAEVVPMASAETGGGTIRGAGMKFDLSQPAASAAPVGRKIPVGSEEMDRFFKAYQRVPPYKQQKALELLDPETRRAVIGLSLKAILGQ